MQAQPERALPATIGRFRVEAEIGRGMMGVVYKAHDPVMDRPVAVKVVHLGFAVDEAQQREFERRFLAEARIVARLSHPDIVVAYDVGLAGEHGPPYIALEFLTGRTLAQVLAEGRPDWRESLRLVARLARALHYAHGQGVVHRDIKPANVMVLANGEPKLMDFGLAKHETGLEKGATGPSVGTPLYMSPEQAMGETVDARSDLFSLGALAYTLLTGRRAFEAESVPRILQRVLHDDPPPPSRLNRALPPSVDYVLARALAKPRDARYADGATLAEDVEDVLALRPPRHRSSWVPPAPAGEETVDSPAPATSGAPPRIGARPELPALELRPRAREGRDEAFELRAQGVPAIPTDAVGERALDGRAQSAAMAGETGAERAVPARHAHLPLTLLVVSMLAFGATLVLSPFWRQQLAGLLGVGTVVSPWLEVPADGRTAASPTPTAAPSAAPSSEPTTQASPTPEATPSASPSEATAADGGAPTAVPTTEADVASATAATLPAETASPSPAPPTDDATPAASATPTSPSATPEALTSAAPSPTPTPTATPKPAARRPAARATARLRMSVTHDLKSGRLKVLIDGRAVLDEALRARHKRYLLVFKRREGTVERDLAVTPGRHLITVQVRAGSRLHSEELRETFAAGAARQLNLRVSGGDGLSFDWE